MKYKIDKYIIEADSPEKATKIYDAIKDSNPPVTKTAEYLWTWERPYEFEFKTLQEINFYYVDLKNEIEKMLRRGYELQKQALDKKRSLRKDATSDLTNIKVLKKETYKDFDDGQTHTLSLVTYIPQGNVDDGSMKNLWATIRDYNGEKVWTKGAIIDVSERLARETFDHQLHMAKVGREAYLKGDSMKDSKYDVVFPGTNFVPINLDTIRFYKEYYDKYPEEYKQEVKSIKKQINQIDDYKQKVISLFNELIK
jgi:hypothetical protein